MKAWIRMLRPGNLLMLIAAQALVSALLLCSAAGVQDSDFIDTIWHGMYSWPAWFAMLASTALVCGGGNVYNDLCDAEADRVNRPGTNAVGLAISRRQAWIFYALLTFSGMVLGLALSWVHRDSQSGAQSGLAVHSAWVGLLPMISALLLWAYSRRLQHMPLAGNLSVAVLIALAVLFPAWSAPLWLQPADWQEGSGRDVLAFALLAAFATWTREWIKDLQDRDGDRAAGGKTAALLLSPSANRIGLLVTLLPQGVLVLGAPLYLRWPHPMGLIGAAILLPVYARLGYAVVKAQVPDDFARPSALAKAVMALGLVWMGLLAWQRCAG
jgi:geranylgeranylglycerol-phosphate geranylgeranyltransferase